MHAVAGLRSTRKVQDVVVGHRRRGTRLVVLGHGNARIVVDGGPLVTHALRKAAVAADPPGARDRRGRREGGQCFGCHPDRVGARPRAARQRLQAYAARVSGAERLPGRGDGGRGQLVLLPLHRRQAATRDEGVQPAAAALGGHHVLADLVRVRADDEITALHGPRQRHVDQPQVLGGAFETDLRLDGRLVAIVAVVQHRQARGVVVLTTFQRAGRATRMPIPEKRAEPDRILQPFGLVDGHDLNQVAVRLQTQLRGVVGASLGALRLQPAQQQLRRPVQLRGLVQGLRQVKQVGQPPLAVGAGQQTFVDAFAHHQAAQHHAHTTLQPEFPVFGEAGDDTEQRGLIRRNRLDACGVEAEHVGGQRRAQQTVAGRFQDRCQHTLQVFGVRALEDAGLRQLDTANPQRGQRLPHLAALGVAAHENGDVATRQRLVADQDFAPLRAVEQSRDLAGTGAGGRMPRGLLGQRLAFIVLRQCPQLQRRTRCGGVVPSLARLGAVVHCLIAQSRQHKGLRID